MSPEDRGGPGDERPWWASEDPTGGGREGPAGSTGAGVGPPHDSAEVCAACPFCSLLRAVGETRPEVVTHLVEAARQLSLAAKALIDAHLEQYPGGEGLEHIPVDGE